MCSSCSQSPDHSLCQRNHHGASAGACQDIPLFPLREIKLNILRNVLCGEQTMCMPEHSSKLNETCSRARAAPINILHGSCCCPHVYPSRLWLEPNVYRGLSALCRRSIEVISITVTCIALLNLETET